MRPKIYGEIKHGNIPLRPEQKAKVEKEMLKWIFSHAHTGLGDEVQYWVTFRRFVSVNAVNCRVEILGDLGNWESTEFSPEPVRAFEHCLADLSPSLLDTGKLESEWSN